MSSTARAVNNGTSMNKIVTKNKQNNDQRKYKIYKYCNKKVKLSLQQAVEAHRVVRRRGSHIFLDNRFTDGGEVVSLMRRPPFTPRKIPGTHFC
jgi:hypothetical protein